MEDYKHFLLILIVFISGPSCSRSYEYTSYLKSVIEEDMNIVEKKDFSMGIDPGAYYKITYEHNESALSLISELNLKRVNSNDSLSPSPELPTWYYDALKGYNYRTYIRYNKKTEEDIVLKWNQDLKIICLTWAKL